MSIAFDTGVCRDIGQAISLEWLRTNGLGGYASGTVSGANTRKYHGLLVVAAHPPVERYVVLSRVEDRAIVGGVTYDLSTDEFPETINPQGYKNLISFNLEAGPVWRYQVGDAVIEKSITLIHGQDTVVVLYKLIGGAARKDAVRLHVQPMLAGRDFHATIQAHYRPSWTIASMGAGTNQIGLSAHECPVRVVLSHNAERFNVSPCWWYNFVFRQEQMRGYPDRDDLWTPGTLEFTLEPGKSAGFICSTKGVAFDQHATLIAQEAARFNGLVHAFDAVAPGDDFVSNLSVAADQFVVQRGIAVGNTPTQTSVIAGYPWFEDWGRDTFISLPGLTLVTNRYPVARSILVTFADHMKDGLLPNRFPDKAFTPDYNTVDAALWFVQAAYEYWRYSGDVKLLKDYLYRPLCEIIEKYRDGTDFGIKMDTDGLVRAGSRGLQLTWMDAKVGDWVVTPRHGKPVEINALWYNALRIMTLLARLAGDGGRAGAYEQLAGRAAVSFALQFWNENRKCLFDVIDDEGNKDGAVRPNQIFAVSLPFSPISPEIQASVVQVVQNQLMTPMGLRTLSPGSMGYHGRCAGDQLARDMAYHQGTAWPWLIGHFVSAYVKVHGGTAAARKEGMAFLEPFAKGFNTFGLGSICEIADGDPPFTPRGCIAQAWSVAEVLRAYWEDVLGKAPAWPHEKVVATVVPQASAVATGV
jgi:predicted glycogen debranching enzyme